MLVPKFSKCKKLNHVLVDIWEDLNDLGVEEINHYKKDFPHEIDFNIAQYGNMRVYYSDIRALYLEAGYSKKWLDSVSDQKLWEIYKRQTGYVARWHFSPVIKLGEAEQ